MVASRKPKVPARKRPETLAQKFERILVEPIGTPFPRMTKREARYFLRRLAGSDPDAPSGAEVVREIRGDWGDRLDALENR